MLKDDLPPRIKDFWYTYLFFVDSLKGLFLIMSQLGGVCSRCTWKPEEGGVIIVSCLMWCWGQSSGPLGEKSMLLTAQAYLLLYKEIIFKGWDYNSVIRQLSQMSETQVSSISQHCKKSNKISKTPRILFFTIITVYVWVFFLHVSLCTVYVPSTQEVQKRVLDLLEMKL